jgi:hypothetical protein
MTSFIKKLLALAMILATGIATAADLPDEVTVESDPIPAAKFAPWKPANPTDYSGTYDGEVGDVGVTLVIKVTKSNKTKAPYEASGTYRHAPTDFEPAVVTFTHRIFNDADQKFATTTAGPVSLTFATYDDKKGVVIGGLEIGAFFIPKATEQSAAAPPARKTHAKWVNFDPEESEPKVPGKHVLTDDGAVVTLPNGHQYITKNDEGAVQLIFPGGQAFSSETAKGDYNWTFVNEDETLVAAIRRPATQTGDLHIYLKGSNGKYREVADAHEQVGGLLKKAYDNVNGEILSLRGITGRTLTLWNTDRRPGGQDEYFRFEFKLEVTPDGKLTLTK